MSEGDADSYPSDERVEDDEWVVRFGENADQTLIDNAQDHEYDHPGEWAVSTVVGRLDPTGLARLRPRMNHRVIHAAYAGDLREAGFEIYSDGRPHGNLVLPAEPTLGDPNLERLRQVMSLRLPNPNYVPKP